MSEVENGSVTGVRYHGIGSFEAIGCLQLAEIGDVFELAASERFDQRKSPEGSAWKMHHHCGKALHISVDSELNSQVREKDAEPLIFEPDVDWNTFKGANIINDY